MIYDPSISLLLRLTPQSDAVRGRAAFFRSRNSIGTGSAGTFAQGMGQGYPSARHKNRLCLGGTLDFDGRDAARGKNDGSISAVGFAGHGVAAATWMARK